MSADYLKRAKAINFLSFVKPWIKPLFYMWKEEMLWRDIWLIMDRDQDINALYKNLLIIGMDRCSNNIEDLYKKNIKLIKGPVKTYQDITSIENKVIREQGYGMIDIKDLKNIMNYRAGE